MADRPKKKIKSGERNPERRNGKAPKKHPKINKVLSPEERAAREALRVERREARLKAEAQVAVEAKAKAEREARLKAEREARHKRQKEAAQRQAAAREAAAKLAKSVKV